MTKVSPNPRTLITVVCLLVFYGLFFVFPICYAFVGSFHDWMPMKGKFEFVGLANYIKVLGQSATATAMGNTLLFTVVVTAARTVLGLIFAVLIHEFDRGKALFRTVYFLPVVTSTVAVSVVWKWLFEPTNGPLNYYITAMGMPSQLFLKDAGSALWCIMFMTIWKDMGYAMVVYMAGLTNISPSLYESASIDGSNRLQSSQHFVFLLSFKCGDRNMRRDLTSNHKIIPCFPRYFINQILYILICFFIKI